MARTRKNKDESTAARVGALVNAGKAVSMETVDFNDPNRPQTCLEVDFPILPINQVAMLEGNAGKPIYQMSKWWARRRSSVFRSMLIAAATKAPDDEQRASKIVWDAYYANFQSRGSFKGIKVADIFMGGGTTLVEGARLGMQMAGNDLNPVAWLVCKNELAPVKPREVADLLKAIEEEVKPQLMPFYATTCPRGHAAKWIDKSDGQVMDADFDSLARSSLERARFRYEGPEVIYTFWAKHGPCQAAECGHRTPIMTSSVVAVKELTVKTWDGFVCSCGETFRIERDAARMAPGVPLYVSPAEPPHAVMDDKGRFECPKCGRQHEDPKARIDGRSIDLGKGKNEKVALTLLVHPQWLKGSGSHDSEGRPHGGSVTDDLETTMRWNAARAATLRLLEVRGPLPDLVTCPETGVSFDPSRGTVPKKSTFTCQEPTCGRAGDVLESIKATAKTGPVAAYAQQCYCPVCDAEGRPYGGRYFQVPDSAPFDKAHEEWLARKDGDLSGFWPTSELSYGFMTHHLQGGVPNHGFTHWWTMFNPRQLLVHATLLKALLRAGNASWEARESVLGGFQQYLRNQNMFCFWNPQRDTPEPHFSNNNYHPKSTVVENCVFPSLGRGNWASCVAGVLEGIEWCQDPWDTLAMTEIEVRDRGLARELSGKSEKVRPGDSVLPNATVLCGSSTDLTALADTSHDLVITDPPFGGLLHYSELADFFYVWLRLALKEKYPGLFGPEYTPKTLEAVANKARHPEDPDAFYERLLTACWVEAHRILKPGGILAFTFHHSEDAPWVGVLKSLFDAGFYLEAIYPIRSDETKGDGEFGSKTIEYDMIHVCRKRVDDPTPVSWARLRRKIVEDVRDLKGLLEQHQASGLPRADLEVIRRGKALEYYSRHYGQVYVEKGHKFELSDALDGIRQVLDDEGDDSGGFGPPVDANVHTRRFLRIFDRTLTVERNDMVKYLRGTAIAPSLFESYGWCRDEKNAYHLCDPLEFARSWHGKHRRGMSRDLDQALFLIGACFADSGMRVDETLNNPNFEPHPAVPDLLDWMHNRGGSPEIRSAARVAQQLYARWIDANGERVERARQQIDFIDQAVA